MHECFCDPGDGIFDFTEISIEGVATPPHFTQMVSCKFGRGVM